MPKTVWILGAGFSASLGGPLLRDLFSKRMELELKAVFGITLRRQTFHDGWHSTCTTMAFPTKED